MRRPTCTPLPRGFACLRVARVEVGSLPQQCIMAGLDFMTIASWLGHSDGGILVGKVYGHLADTHKKAAAQKLSFFS